MSFLSEMISALLDKGPGEETEITHSKFVSSVVDTLKSEKASNEETLQALRDLGAIVYIGKFQVTPKNVLSFVSLYWLQTCEITAVFTARCYA